MSIHSRSLVLTDTKSREQRDVPIWYKDRQKSFWVREEFWYNFEVYNLKSRRVMK